MTYSIVYSKRRTVSLTVKDGELIVRAPRGLSRSRIDDIVKKHEKWIKKKLDLQKISRELFGDLTDDDVVALKRDAKRYFEQKADYYAKIMGLKYSRITITSAKKRFGSCSSEGRICFSYRLMLYPQEAREYVVVHELAHLVHMNHSKDFYALIAQYLPDYKERKRLLM